MAANLLFLNQIEPEPVVYFTTNLGGIQKFSRKTRQVATIWNSTEELEGIAFDSANRVLYWTTSSEILRSNMSPFYPEILLITSQCELHF